jgi:serine/threonine-protein kinase
MAWQAAGVLDKALADLNQAIQTKPDLAEAFRQRGNLNNSQRAYLKALADYDKAVALAPDASGSLNDLAWFLATCPEDKFRNGKRAVEVAAKACELTQHKDFSLVDTLAAAHAEAGDFAQAVKLQQQTIDLAKGQADDENLKELNARLELYKKSQPYREAPSK